MAFQLGRRSQKPWSPTPTLTLNIQSANRKVKYFFRSNQKEGIHVARSLDKISEFVFTLALLALNQNGFFDFRSIFFYIETPKIIFEVQSVNPEIPTFNTSLLFKS